VALIFIF